MTPTPSGRVSPIRVRLWAGARAAAGAGEVAVDVAGPVSVSWLAEELVRRFPDRDRLPQVIGVCSVLVSDRPVGTADPAEVTVAPGETVEFLPPFAGG
jgi:molybdopterin synthase sulfur carrier subunit